MESNSNQTLLRAFKLSFSSVHKVDLPKESRKRLCVLYEEVGNLIKVELAGAKNIITKLEMIL